MVIPLPEAIHTDLALLLLSELMSGRSGVEIEFSQPPHPSVRRSILFIPFCQWRLKESRIGILQAGLHHLGPGLISPFGSKEIAKTLLL
jgi:hypothetical protein